MNELENYRREDKDQPVQLNAISQIQQDSAFFTHWGGLPKPLSEHVEKMMDTSKFSTHYEPVFQKFDD